MAENGRPVVWLYAREVVPCEEGWWLFKVYNAIYPAPPLQTPGLARDGLPVGGETVAK